MQLFQAGFKKKNISTVKTCLSSQQKQGVVASRCFCSLRIADEHLLQHMQVTFLWLSWLWCLLVNSK